MGLYDSFKPTNSTAVKQFAGSMVPELRETKKNLEENYLKARDMFMKNEELLATTDIAEGDRPALEQIANEVNEAGNKIVESGRWENALPQLYSMSSKTVQKIKQLQDRKVMRDKYQATLAHKDLNLPQFIQEELLQTSDAANGPAQFDQYNRTQPYKPAKLPVEHLDNNKMIREAVIATVRSQGVTVDESKDPIDIKTEGDRYKVQIGSQTVEISGESLKAQLENALHNDPRWQESLNQEAWAASSKATKNASEEEALAAIEDPKTMTDQEAARLYSTGSMTAKEALQKAHENEFLVRRKNDLSLYAQGAASRTVSQSTSTGPSSAEQQRLREENAKADLQRAKDLEKYNNELVVGLGGTVTLPGGTDVFEASAGYSQNIANADEQIRINKTYLEAHPNAPFEQRAIAQADLAEAEDLKRRMTAMSSTAEKDKKGYMEVAAKNLSNGLKDYNEYIADDRNKLWNTVTKAKVNGKLPDGTVVKVPALALLRAYDVGGITVYERHKTPNSWGGIWDKDEKVPTDVATFPNHQDVPVELRGKRVRLDQVVAPYTEARSKLDKEAKRLAKEGSAVVTTDVPIAPAVKTQLKDMAPGMALYDVSGTKKLSGEDLQDIDWKTAEVGTYLNEVGMIRMNVTIDGKPQQVLADVSKTNLFDVQGGVLSVNKDPNIRSLGAVMSDPRFEDFRKSIRKAASSGVDNVAGRPIVVNGKPAVIVQSRSKSYHIVYKDGSGVAQNNKGVNLTDLSMNDAAFAVFSEFYKQDNPPKK